MRVEFDVTLDDAVDVSLRTLARSKAARSWRWMDYAGGMLLSGLLVVLGGIAVLYLLDLLGTVSREILIGASLFGAIIAAALYPSSHRKNVKHRLLRYYREQLGDREAFHAAVELSPGGILVQQENMQLTFQWSEVEGVEETANAIYLLMQKRRVIAIRMRAFESARELDQFLDEIDHYRHQARQAAADRPPLPGEETFFDPQAKKRPAPQDEGA